MDEKKKVWKNKSKNREWFEEDKKGWVQRRKEGKRNLRKGRI